MVSKLAAIASGISSVVSRMSQREIESMPSEKEALNGTGELVKLLKTNWKPGGAEIELAEDERARRSSVARLMSSAQVLAAATGSMAPMSAPAAGTRRRIEQSHHSGSFQRMKIKSSMAAKPSSMAAP